MNEYGTSASVLVICGHGLADSTADQEDRTTDEEGC